MEFTQNVKSYYKQLDIFNIFVMFVHYLSFSYFNRKLFLHLSLPAKGKTKTHIFVN